MNWKGSLEDYIKANPGLDGEPSLASPMFFDKYSDR